MSWFRKKASSAAEQIGEAQAAIERAENSMAATRARQPEVDRLAESLETRKDRNHFGETLQRAMEKRQ